MYYKNVQMCSLVIPFSPVRARALTQCRIPFAEASKIDQKVNS